MQSILTVLAREEEDVEVGQPRRESLPAAPRYSTACSSALPCGSSLFYTGRAAAREPTKKEREPVKKEFKKKVLSTSPASFPKLKLGIEKTGIP